MEKQDIKIVCKDCGQEFLFTVGEQNFFEEKGLTNQPVRCKECRAKKKAAMQEKSNNERA